jgi:hypothetical protein
MGLLLVLAFAPALVLAQSAAWLPDLSAWLEATGP